MKRLIPFLFVLFTGVGWLSGQVSQPPGVILVATAPSGTCAAGVQGQLVVTTGIIWTCQAGVWAPSGGGGGSFTALTGDATSTSTGGATTVLKVNGGSIPTSQSYVGTNSSGQIVAAATPGSSTQFAATSAEFGMHNYGDSITAGVGCTATSLCYVPLMVSDFAWNAALNNNLGNAGDFAADMNVKVFNNENPATTGNPIVTTMIGTNNVGQGTATNTLLAFQQTQAASHAWIALSTNEKLAGSTASTTGTCANDTTFSTVTGEQCTSTGATVTWSNISAANQIIYLWYRALQTSTGSATCTIDSAAATDTFTSSTTLSAQALGGLPGNVVSNDVQLARFVTTGTGTHTVACTSTNTFSYVALGMPPELHYRGLTSPKVVLGGVPFQENATGEPTAGTYNTQSQTVATLLYGDGLNVAFFNPRLYVNAYCDMGSPSTTQCPASSNPGLHPNNNGHRNLANGFEDVLNMNTDVVASSLTTEPLVATAPAAANALTGFDNFAPHSFSDTLLRGFSMCSGTFCGFKEFSNGSFGSGYGFGAFAQSGSGKEVCLGNSNASAGSTTSESNFTWQACLTVDDGIWHVPAIQINGGAVFTASIGLGTSFYSPVTNANGTPTPGTGVTSVTCASASCTNLRGTYTIVGGTGTTGTIASLVWTSTTSAYVCTATQNGGAVYLGIGNSVATATGMNITANVAVTGITFSVNYECQP